jgi:flagellar biosynthesis protein
MKGANRKNAPQKKAVALKYRAGADSAPRVVARGRGLVAEKILELARACNVPIHEDADLAEILALLEPGAEIPPETYLVVAEILAFLYRANESAGTRHP